MKETFIPIEADLAEEAVPKQQELQSVDLAGTVKQARLAEQRRREEWEAAQRDKTQEQKDRENPYKDLSDEELMVLAGEELSTKQMKKLISERQKRRRS
jgi:hypothetical protein